MKFYKILMISIIIIAAAKFLSAQSDYQIVHNFNVKYQLIHENIKDADSLAQLEQLEDSIQTLKSNFVANKELLDKSLYPNDFTGSIVKLQNELALRKKDFTQIKTLQTQVSGLQIQIDTLNSHNTALLGRIQSLEIQNKKDEKTIANLKRNISSLMVSLNKRDNLIMSMLDSLMPPTVREEAQLTKGEKQKVYSKAEKQNVISNIKKAINDNIKFLNITSLSPSDINNIKKQESTFEKLWTSMGPKFAAIYSEKEKGTADINEINAKFAQWKEALKQEAWDSIKDNFANYDINLQSFTNGNEFADVIKKHIQDEINNAHLKGKAAIQDYTIFADSAWYGDVKPKWVPYLEDNNMLTAAQQDTIEANINQWHDVVSPNPLKWFLIAAGALVIIFAIFLFIKSSKRKRKNPKMEEKEIGSTA